MPKIYRNKHSMTQGEITPLLTCRSDFAGVKNGCYSLKNMVVLPQGPVTRRPGFEFIYDMADIDFDTANPRIRMIPFVFNELQAYVMVFYQDILGNAVVVFAYENGLIVYPDEPLECPPGTPISPSPGSIVSITLPDGWNIEQFDYAQSADYMYFAQPDLPPYVIKRYDHYCWTAEEVQFTDAPPEWGPGDDAGYPERVTFHQQRLVFACNRARRQTLWMSKAGSFHDFGISDPLVDDDAITATLDSGTQNRIQWLISARILNIGTLGNEWTVTGGAQMAVTPRNLIAVPQSNLGSEPNKAMMAGQVLLYIQRYGKVINEFIYDYNSDSFVSTDILVLANHLTEHYKVVDWAYQQTPESVLWCVREDGVLLGCTFHFQHKVIGWSQHTTQGNILEIASIPGQASHGDDVWVLVHRVVNNINRYYLEKLSEWFSEDEAEWGRFLDCYSVYTGQPVNILQGLDFLEGLTVSVLADGAVHAPVTVVNGEIVLDNYYSHIIVGLPYDSEVWPISLELSLNDGTSEGRTQRISYLHVDFYKSSTCVIGRYSSEDGQIVEERPFRWARDTTGEQVPLFTGKYRFDFMEGYDYESVYFIRQNKPLPLTIRGIIDEIEVNA